ncbi:MULTISPECIES: hypothetical protein [Prevotella]|jgi:hypothetical protein|nr:MULTISPECIES: hypothetical protein [Prevotella]MDD6854439.1 hypothetical protein [Prevotella sp.]MDY6266996.1 hypothetical protein [Prevotella sp.]
MIHNFTNEDFNPSERTLNLIRQIAYTYRTVEINGRKEAYCLN